MAFGNNGPPAPLPTGGFGPTNASGGSNNYSAGAAPAQFNESPNQAGIISGADNPAIAGAGGAGGSSNTSGTENALGQFYTAMTGPIDWNDPQTQSILQGASSSAGAAANAQGIGGPMSVNASQQAYTNAAATMQMQRAGLGLQALGQLSNTQLGTGQLGVAQGQLGVAQGQLGLEQGAQGYEESFNNQYAPWEIAAGIVGGAGGLASGLGKLSTLKS